MATVFRVIGWIGVALAAVALGAAFLYAEWAAAGAMIAMFGGLLAWKMFSRARSLDDLRPPRAP